MVSQCHLVATWGIGETGLPLDLLPGLVSRKPDPGLGTSNLCLWLQAKREDNQNPSPGKDLLGELGNKEEAKRLRPSTGVDREQI